MSDNGLPEGWVDTEIGELINLTSGKYIPSKKYSKDKNKPFPVAGAGGPIGWTSEANFEAPILTLGRVGACGAVNMYNTAAWVTDNSLVVMPYFPDLLPFLKLFFESVNWSQYNSGSSQPLINQKTVNSIPFRCPPLAEQRRIVAKVEELLAEVNAARDRLAKVPAILKRFRQSVLAAACSGRLTEDWRERNGFVEPNSKTLKMFDSERRSRFKEVAKKSKASKLPSPKKPNWLSYDSSCCESDSDLPESWVKCPVGFLCDCVVPGRDKPKTFTGKTPWVTLPDILSMEIDCSQKGLGLTKAEIAEVKARLLPVETVVMSCVGRFGISSIVKTPLVVNQQLHGFLPSKAIIPKYLAYHIQTMESYMSGIATSTTIAYMNKDKCNSVPINVPPIGEQLEIVQRLESLLTVVGLIEKKCIAASNIANKTGEAVLAKAFRGELVPTEAELAQAEGRDYEPASVLLERIQVAREEVKPKKKSKKTKRRRTRSRG
jgi:type I restriction enzyme S subunit